MTPTQWMGFVLVACALASILLMVVACFVLGRRTYPKQRRDVADTHRAARTSGFVDSREVQR